MSFIAFVRLFLLRSVHMKKPLCFLTLGIVRPASQIVGPHKSLFPDQQVNTSVIPSFRLRSVDGHVTAPPLAKVPLLSWIIQESFE